MTPDEAAAMWLEMEKAQRRAAEEEAARRVAAVEEEAACRAVEDETDG